MEQALESDHDSLTFSLSQTLVSSTPTSDSEFSDPALVEPDLVSDPNFHEGVTEALDSVFDEAEVLRCGGLRVVGIDSDSDSDSEYVESEDNHNPNPNPDFSVSESQRIEEFDWEEVAGRVDDVDEEAEVSIASDHFTDEGNYDEEEGGPSFHNLEWEFLLAVNNMHRSLILDSDPYVSAHEDFVHAVGMDDHFFDQIVENEMGFKGSPPAAKTVVENLPLVALSEECVCAVCKDEMVVGDPVRKLPCLHCYHGDCILPWLAMRNSCPVCRYELPTDDLDYERSKSGSRRDGGAAEWDSRVSWDVELFA